MTDKKNNSKEIKQLLNFLEEFSFISKNYQESTLLNYFKIVILII